MRELAALSEKRKISTSELLALIEELKYRRESKLREATRVKCESLLAKAAKRKPRSQLVYLESANPQTDIVSRPQRPEGALGDLERGSTLKERTLRHFAEDEAGLVKAPWWWWFANLTSIKILSGVEYQIVSSKNSEIKISLPLSDDFEFIFHDKLFYSRLEIRSDGTLLKGNLSKTQALLVKQNESARVLRRQNTPRGPSYEQEIESFFTRGSRACSAHGARAQFRVPVAVGCCAIHRTQDRLHA